MDIVAFTDEHVDGAAGVLAERHAAHLAVEPLLPHRTDFAAQVEKEREEGTGAVAVEAGEVVGYLLGNRREDFLGPHIWSHVAGHAVRDPELVRDLYAAAASRWVEAGLTRHFVFVPAIRELVEPWLRVTFGISAALAARETSPDEEVGDGVAVRLSTPEDTPVAAAFGRVLAQHLTEPPSFSFFTPPSEQEYLDEWRNVHGEPEFTHFVAERDGRVVGHVLMYRRPEGDLRVPPGNIDLAAAATLDDVRGTGVGLALTSHVLAWAHEEGFRSMTADWRSVNLLSSRFWPRRGFRPQFLRLYRAVP